MTSCRLARREVLGLPGRSTRRRRREEATAIGGEAPGASCRSHQGGVGNVVAVEIAGLPGAT